MLVCLFVHYHGANLTFFPDTRKENFMIILDKCERLIEETDKGNTGGLRGYASSKIKESLENV